MRKALVLFIILSVALVACGKKAVVKKVDDPGIIYVQGVDQMKQKKYDKAIASFARLRENYPFDPMAIIAQIKQADVYFAKKEYQLAAGAYEDFVNSYPEDENAPYAMKRLCESYEKELPTIDRDQTITLKAMERYTFLKNRYPQSPYAAEADAHLLSLNKRLAAREYYIGEFYYKTGNYNASIMRLEYFLSRYPDAENRDKALYYLAQSYKELDRPDRERQCLEILAKEYPKSQYARPTQKERKAQKTSRGASASAADVAAAKSLPVVAAQSLPVAAAKSLPVAAVTRASFSYDEKKKKEIPLRPVEAVGGDLAVDNDASQGEEGRNAQSAPTMTAQTDGGRAATAAGGKETKAGDEKKDTLGFFSGKGPIEINGDAGEALEKGKVLIFKGNVVAKQLDPDPTQTFYLFCDKLTAYTTEDTKEIERVEAEGSVKLVKQDKTATSKQAFYYKDKGQLILKGDVVVFMGTDKLSADTVTYYVEEDRFYVQGDKEKRAKATITPRKK